MVSLKGPSTLNMKTLNNNQSQNNDQSINTTENNSQGDPPRTKNNITRHKYTPLKEPIESSLKNLVQSNIITLPNVLYYEPVHFKLS